MEWELGHLVRRQTLTQVTISQLVSSSPTSGSVLTAQSLEPALDPVSPSLSLSAPPAPPPSSVSLSKININKYLKIKINKKYHLSQFSNWTYWRVTTS